MKEITSVSNPLIKGLRELQKPRARRESGLFLADSEKMVREALSLSLCRTLAVEAGQVSISMLQRRLRVGYARAGRLVDEMTLRGITAEAEGPTKPRTVLISREEWRRMQENQE